MKLLAIPLTILFLLSISGPGEAAEFPYERKTRQEVILWTAGGVTAGLGLWLSGNIEPLTPEEVASLDPEDVNGFDSRLPNRPYEQVGTQKILIPLIDELGMIWIRNEHRPNDRRSSRVSLFGQRLGIGNQIAVNLSIHRPNGK